MLPHRSRYGGRLRYTPQIVKWQILSVTLSHRERVWASTTKMAVSGSWPRGRSEAQLDRGTSAGSLLGTVGQPALRLRSGESSTTCESSCFAPGFTEVRRVLSPGSDANFASQPVEDQPAVLIPWMIWVV